MKEREIEDVVETLRTSKGCSLLIGSGCSIEAGIPIADDFVPDIKEKFPRAYERACRGGEEATYLNCMKELSEFQRRKLIKFYVDNAKLNWAHIAIAQLIANGFVDRVLTVNFDPLVIKACALIGQFPAVYDIASSQKFKDDAIPEKAVFYLHGQYTGFVLMITEADVEEHSEKLDPVFRDAGRGRPWIVVGYSGKNDPVCTHLSNVPNFDHDLYWICYEDRTPCEDVRKNLLEQDKSAYVVKGYDADGFFVTLAQKLDIFPPDLITHPFTHLEAQLDQLTSYKIPHHEHEVDIKKHGLLLVKEAIETIENKLSPELQADAKLMAGDYDGVIDIGKDEKKPEPELDESRAWAAFLQGIDIFSKAITKTGQEEDKLFELVYENYKAAVDIKPDFLEAFNNWGNAFSNQAKMKDGEEANRLFAQAYEKYKAAVDINSNDHEVFNNWGLALLDQAKMKDGKEADKLFEQAYEKFKAAVDINPDDHEAFNNWGATLIEQANMKDGEEGARLLEQALERCKAAVDIKPKKPIALYNWGTVLLKQAKAKDGDEADKLFEQAYEKYKAAVDINPDFHEAFINWSIALLEQVKMKDGEEANKLIEEAIEKCIKAESILPGSGAYNLACINAMRGQEPECRKWLEISRDTGHLPSKEDIEKDSDFDSVRDSDWFKKFLDSI